MQEEDKNTLNSHLNITSTHMNYKKKKGQHLPCFFLIFSFNSKAEVSQQSSSNKSTKYKLQRGPYFNHKTN